ERGCASAPWFVPAGRRLSTYTCGTNHGALAQPRSPVGLRAGVIVSILTVRDVTKTYANVRAVDGVSFAVRRGEIFALLGPNGAGKTTLVRLLLGILPPDDGQI